MNMRRRACAAVALALAISPLAAAAGAGAGAGAGDATLGLPALVPPPTARVQLGRALFFERRLSANGTLSCAMCHLPEQGFTSNEVRISVGMEGVSLRRNAPTLLNVAYVAALFHDGRAGSLEQQALMPVLHPDEMGNAGMKAVVARVVGWPEYRPLFRHAFGSATPTASRIARALAAFERTLTAGGSRFDRWRYGGDVSALTAQEQHGFALFQSQGCVACHPVGSRDALLTDQGYHNVGIQARSDALRQRDLTVQLLPGVQATLTPAEIARVGVTDAPDLGRQEVTHRAADARAFRTPSLRNVALTAPYMHDGSFDTLEQVVDHYIAGGWPADPAQDPRISPLALDRAGRDAIVAFLRSLTTAHVPEGDRATTAR
jgi:cytochrome c peroxidase